MIILKALIVGFPMLSAIAFAFFALVAVNRSKAMGDDPLCVKGATLLSVLMMTMSGLMIIIGAIISSQLP